MKMMEVLKCYRAALASTGLSAEGFVYRPPQMSLQQIILQTYCKKRTQPYIQLLNHAHFWPKEVVLRTRVLNQTIVQPNSCPDTCITSKISRPPQLCYVYVLTGFLWGSCRPPAPCRRTSCGRTCWTATPPTSCSAPRGTSTQRRTWICQCWRATWWVSSSSRTPWAATTAGSSTMEVSPPAPTSSSSFLPNSIQYL